MHASEAGQGDRRFEYEKRHPGVTIEFLRPAWRAVVPEDEGETIVARYDLKSLLDKLESLDGASPAG
jgi:hypothetical protein